MQIKVILIKSTGKTQVTEVISTVIQIYNKVSVSDINKTILHTKRHKLEKQQAHLRFRTKIFGSIMRIRHQLSFCAPDPIRRIFLLSGFFLLAYTYYYFFRS